MNDRKRTKICICIVIFMLAAIVATHFCLGHYLRTAQLIDTRYAYYEGGIILPELFLSLKEAKAKYPEAFKPNYYVDEKGPLSEGDTLKVLIAADIVLAGAGIFIILLYLSITAPHPIRTRVLLGMFIVYIAAAVILFFFMYKHFSNLTYTVLAEKPEGYWSLKDYLDY